MTRDSGKTKEKLLKAAGAIIKSKGFDALGVNAVAKEAGVDKVLVYRYFGNLDGLIDEYISRRDYYSNINIMLSKYKDVETVEQLLKVIKKVFAGQIKQLQNDSELRKFLLWELNNKNEITTKIAAEREKYSIDLIKTLKTKFRFNVNQVESLFAIISSSIYYLVLRADTVDVFTGVKINEGNGWKIIEKEINTLVDTLADKITPAVK